MNSDLDSQERLTATRKHDETLSPGTDAVRDYFDRAIARLRQSEWDKARADLASAIEGGIDVAAAFIETYGDAGEFEDAYDVELPGDIADIVDPISEEEDAALVRLTQEGLKTDLVSRECLMAILRGEDGN